ncbi:glycoside hydrolase family 125 protein [Glaciibacter superstes]|uniref:glycoside hydrolase family 125 protein n=1 Tax=Glaciibacter superstes TaxID=501023 RepID=UPI0003B43605|nr:glycoside hydrolase family 125 protein [Glaciibacter superstes]
MTLFDPQTIERVCSEVAQRVSQRIAATFRACFTDTLTKRWCDRQDPLYLATRASILRTLAATDAGTFLMHESFDKDDPSRFTRGWFSWANAMFCELVLDVAGLRSHERDSWSAKAEA